MQNPSRRLVKHRNPEFLARKIETEPTRFCEQRQITESSVPQRGNVQMVILQSKWFENAMLNRKSNLSLGKIGESLGVPIGRLLLAVSTEKVR
jgi:hypothetical protein